MAFLNHWLLRLRRQEEHRMEWLECPDAMYFSGRLEHEMHAASAAVASLIHAKADEVCLMSNATDAAVTVASRWATKLRDSAPGAKVMMLNCAYRANEYILRHHCGAAGAEVVEAAIPFPLRRTEDALTGLDAALRLHKPRFVSQPSKLCTEEASHVPE